MSVLVENGEANNYRNSLIPIWSLSHVPTSVNTLFHLTDNSDNQQHPAPRVRFGVAGKIVFELNDSYRPDHTQPSNAFKTSERKANILSTFAERKGICPITNHIVFLNRLLAGLHTFPLFECRWNPDGCNCLGGFVVIENGRHTRGLPGGDIGKIGLSLLPKATVLMYVAEEM